MCLCTLCDSDHQIIFSASTQPILNASVVQTFARKHYVFDCGWIDFPTETWTIEQRTNQLSILRFETPKLGPCLTPNLGVKSVFPVHYLFRMFFRFPVPWNPANTCGTALQQSSNLRQVAGWLATFHRTGHACRRFHQDGACFRSLLMLGIIMVTSMFFMCSMIVPPIMVKSPDINLTYGKSLR